MFFVLPFKGEWKLFIYFTASTELWTGRFSESQIQEGRENKTVVFPLGDIRAVHWIVWICIWSRQTGQQTIRQRTPITIVLMRRTRRHTERRIMLTRWVHKSLWKNAAAAARQISPLDAMSRRARDRKSNNSESASRLPVICARPASWLVGPEQLTPGHPVTPSGWPCPPTPLYSTAGEQIPTPPNNAFRLFLLAVWIQLRTVF